MRPLLFSLLAALSPLPAPAGAAEFRLPNIVVIVADDLGYGEAPGGPIPTPHIDALASRGVRFTHGYVTAPFCAASRAGLITGRYQTRFGFEFNPIGARNEEPGIGLPAGEKTLADRLSEQAGYATALVGKWHLGGTAPFHPMRRGFDEFFGFLHEGHTFTPPPHGGGMVSWFRRKTLPGGGEGRWTSGDGLLTLTTHMGHHEPDYDANNPILRSSQPVDEPANLIDAFTRESVLFIERNRERPFFLCLAHNAVHSPMQADAAHFANFPNIEDIHRRIFAAMLTHLDDSVGKVTGALENAGVSDRTMVFFISDNGGPTRELTSRNDPLRGEKGNLLEGGIRVPFLASWPGVFPAGTVCDTPVISLDIAATALAAAKLDAKLDGADLRPLLTGKTTDVPHERLFWRVGEQAALRSGDWKLVRPAKRGEAAAWELYRIDHDVGESDNLARQEPATLRELISAWESMNAEMADPLWR